MSDLWFDYDSTAINSATSNAYAASGSANSNLDKDAFLQLLITQMQYQDPLNPMDNADMLAQLAQFSSLEQMQNVASSTLKSTAFSMIGKMVEGTYRNSAGENDVILGVVSSVLVQNGKTYLQVGEQLLQVENVTNVYTDPLTSINTSLSTSQSFSLIGKTVQAITLDASYNATGFVEGTVDYIKFSSSGGTILVVGDKEIYPSEIVSVGTDNLLIDRSVGLEEADEDGVYSVVEYPITGVEIVDEKAYLKINGTRVYIEKINYATDALALVGKEITYMGLSGTVTGVTIKDGVPYLRMGDNEVSFKLYKNITDETAEE